ncbi:MAG: hypothetical protein ABH811_02175 [archaeon]
MKKELIVISLGGSLIIPENIDVKFLREFRKVILSNTKKYKFVIVCGGGTTARKYIGGLENENIKNKKVLQSFLGIAATRLNSRFMTYFFGEKANSKTLETSRSIKRYLKKHDVAFLYTDLKYESDKTSDSTSAEIARDLRADFINLTNVEGLYNKNPKKYKNAKFIPKISWSNFYKIANKIKYHPGQHFVLDQMASKIILENKVKTCIIGKNLKQLDNFLKGKKFKGTVIGR